MCCPPRGQHNILKYLSSDLTIGHVGFMQIPRVARSCRLGSQVEFVLGPDESK